MSRKDFDAAVQQTVKGQGEAAQNQFDMAESILLNAKSASSARSSKKESSVERAIFSMPPTDFALINMLRARAGDVGRYSTTKSEIVRAGLHALAALEEPAFLEMLNALQKVRKGN